MKHMKKVGKFVFGTLSLATLAAGAYFIYKNFIKKDISDDFDEFEDDFDNLSDFDSEEESAESSETREYVPIQIDKENVNVEDTNDEYILDQVITADIDSNNVDAQDEAEEEQA